MTAFAGFIAFDGPLQQDVEKRLAASLHGVGLDRARIRRDGNAVLICRQRVLSHEDRFEAQPCAARCGAWSVFDGRLDNRVDLLEILGLGGASERIPDGLVAARAYDRWGTDAPARLLGEFAWAVWDAARNQLLLARDHSVSRQLLFSRGPGFVAFSTSYPALLGLPQVARTVDDQALSDLLMRSPDASDHTVFHAIRWVRPAHSVLVRRDAAHARAFWRPAPGAFTNMTDRGWLEAGREVLDRAVRARLRVEGPILTTATGGLDSSAVAATAARLAKPKRITALTMVPQQGAPLRTRVGTYADEKLLVQALADLHDNVDLEMLEARDPAAFEADPAIWFAKAGTPARDLGHSAWFLPLFERAAALGSGVVLDGSFGNMTLSYHGYSYLGRLRLAGRPIALAQMLWRMRRHMPQHRWRSQLLAQLRAYLPAWKRRKPHVGDWAHRAFLNPDLAMAAERRRWEENLSRLEVFKESPRIDAIRHHIERSRQRADIAAGLRAMTGVTLSDPFHDRRVIEFCLSLPPEQFLLHGIARSFARRLYADRLPSVILQNQERGAQNGDWHARLTKHRAAMAEMAGALTRSHAAARLLDLPRIAAHARDWPDELPALGESYDAYAVFLGNAFHVGHFHRWLEGPND